MPINTKSSSPYVKLISEYTLGGDYCFLYSVCETLRVEIIDKNNKFYSVSNYDVCLISERNGREFIKSFKTFKKALSFIETNYVPNSLKFIEKL